MKKQLGGVWALSSLLWRRQVLQHTARCHTPPLSNTDEIIWLRERVSYLYPQDGLHLKLQFEQDKTEQRWYLN